MPVVDLLCLANSYKHGHRCVAGLQTQGARWMRPVSNSGDGHLCRYQYRLSSSEPEILDVIRIGLSNAKPQPHQPENWLIDDSPWQLISRPAPASLRLLLRSILEPGPWLFGGLTNSIRNSSGR